MKTMTLCLLTLALATPVTVHAQFGEAMKKLLRPHMDPEYCAEGDWDVDQEFVRDMQTLIRDALPEKLSVQPKGKVKVLVLTQGTYGPLHAPASAGYLSHLRAAAEKFPALEITEVYEDNNITANQLKAYDVVVLNNVGRAQHNDVFNEILPAYVRGGGGLLAMHATGLLYIKEPDAKFNAFLGGYVDTINTQYGHPSKQGKPFPVQIVDADHPIMAAFKAPAQPLTLPHRWLSGKKRGKYNVKIEPPQTLADELYVFFKPEGQRPEPRVLMVVDKDKAQQEYPEGSSELAYALAWIKDIGQGRVFYTQLGHNMGVYAVPQTSRMMLDALLYCAGVLKEE